MKDSAGPGASGPKRRISLRLSVALIFLSLLIVGGSVLYLVYLRWDARETGALQSELDLFSTDSPDVQVPIPPFDERNAAYWWEKAAEQLASAESMEELWRAHFSQEGLTEEVRAEARVVLGANMSALETARKASSCDTSGYPIRVSDVYYDGPDPFSAIRRSRRALGRLLLLRMDGVSEERLESAKLLLSLAHSLRDCPSVADQLDRHHLHHWFWSPLRRWINDGMNADERLAIHRALEAGSHQPGMRMAIREERTHTAQHLSGLLDGSVDADQHYRELFRGDVGSGIAGSLMFTRPLLKRAYADYLRGMRESLSALNLPHAECLDELQLIRIKATTDDNRNPRVSLTTILFPVMGHWWTAATETEANVRIVRYILKPEKNIPEDPFGGVILRRELGDQVILWSVGPDGRDDSKPEEEWADSDDIVWKVPRSMLSE